MGRFLLLVVGVVLIGVVSYFVVCSLGSLVRYW